MTTMLPSVKSHYRRARAPFKQWQMADSAAPSTALDVDGPNASHVVLIQVRTDHPAPTRRTLIEPAPLPPSLIRPVTGPAPTERKRKDAGTPVTERTAGIVLQPPVPQRKRKKETAKTTLFRIKAEHDYGDKDWLRYLQVVNDAGNLLHCNACAKQFRNEIDTVKKHFGTETHKLALRRQQHTKDSHHNVQHLLAEQAAASAATPDASRRFAPGTLWKNLSETA